MSFLRRFLIAGTTASFLLTASVPVFAAAVEPCVSETVGVDTSLAQEFVVAFRGMSAGQTFTATDTNTLIRSITVWGQPYGPPTLMKLWVTETNPTSGTPLLANIIQEGPVVASERGVGRPVKVQFVLDPPVVLPGAGHYAFFIQDPCALYFDLCINGEDPFPGGELQRTSRTRLTGCRIDGVFGSWGTYDLIFEIEFCSDATTSVRSKSWGALKTIYR